MSADPDDQPAMSDLDVEERRIALASLGPESQLARDERTAGVTSDRLPCRLLIVTGTADTFWARERYADLPVSDQHLVAEVASHCGVQLNPPALSPLSLAALRRIQNDAA